MNKLRTGGLLLGGLAAVTLLIGRKAAKDAAIDEAFGLGLDASLNDIYRKTVVETAIGQIGEQDPAKYWSQCSIKPPYPTNWCGGFVIWVLKSAGLAQLSEWEIGTALKPTFFPQPGDVAWIDLGKSTGPTDTRGHKAIVESVTDTTVTTIDGNQDPDPTKTPHIVARATRPRNKFSGFFSIDPLIKRIEDA